MISVILTAKLFALNFEALNNVIGNPTQFVNRPDRLIIIIIIIIIIIDS
jgi:hypothetical protein